MSIASSLFRLTHDLGGSLPIMPNQEDPQLRIIFECDAGTAHALRQSILNSARDTAHPFRVYSAPTLKDLRIGGIPVEIRVVLT